MSRLNEAVKANWLELRSWISEASLNRISAEYGVAPAAIRAEVARRKDWAEKQKKMRLAEQNNGCCDALRDARRVNSWR